MCYNGSMASESFLPADIVTDAVVAMDVCGTNGQRFWGGLVTAADPEVGRVHVRGYRHKGASKTFSLSVRKDGKYDSLTNELVTMRLATGKEKATILRFRDDSVVIGVQESTHVTRRSVKKTELGLGVCLCGCGGATQSRFIAGHDSRIHSLLSKIVKGQTGPETLPDIFVANFRSVGFCVKDPRFLTIMESLTIHVSACVECANGIPFAEQSTTIHASGQPHKA